MGTGAPVPKSTHPILALVGGTRAWIGGTEPMLAIAAWQRNICPAGGGKARFAGALQRAGDHQALDLVGALVDLGDLGVAHHPLDRILADVAISAEDLDR